MESEACCENLLFAKYTDSDISDEGHGEMCCYCGEKGDLNHVVDSCCPPAIRAAWLRACDLSRLEPLKRRQGLGLMLAGAYFAGRFGTYCDVLKKRCVQQVGMI